MRERDMVVEGRSHIWVLFVQAKRRKEGEEESQFEENIKVRNSS